MFASAAAAARKVALPLLILSMLMLPIVDAIRHTEDSGMEDSAAGKCCLYTSTMSFKWKSSLGGRSGCGPTGHVSASGFGRAACMRLEQLGAGACAQVEATDASECYVKLLMQGTDKPRSQTCWTCRRTRTFGGSSPCPLGGSEVKRSKPSNCASFRGSPFSTCQAVSVPCPSSFVEAEVELVDDAASTLGKCTDEDKNAMEAAGAGNSADSFPASAAKCGSSAFSLIWGFQEEKYNECLSEKVHISPACSSCFADSGHFGVGNCKAACLFSWCGEGCLKCIGGYTAELQKCVGFAPPDAKAC